MIRNGDQTTIPIIFLVTEINKILILVNRGANTMTDADFTLSRFEALQEIEAKHFWFSARRRLLRGMLRQRFQAKIGTLVDLGCGPGFNLGFWREFAQEVTGVDMHMSGPEHLPEGIHGLRADASKVPLADGAADVVMALDLLEHTDDIAVLHEAYRILRPGGTLLISVPAHPWLWSTRDVDAGHRRRYTRASLLDLLSRTGFEAGRVVYYQAVLFPLVVLSRLLGRKSQRPRDIEDRPPRIVNGLFTLINTAEVQWSLAGLPLPTGSTLVVAGRKPEEAA